ncbi:bis(5'-nucleosyl)-tetraphosphatase (symmetrical) YqeK [Paenibacillus nasutitermitis]|uniref:Haloacid dehalogenase n=1 Tax=Paenibacillus nasutitermitis TaxID=1652958 RepID=A0A916ZGG1_9BACL|nr:bis(5'-nucleosyl)-tetraphosphatase (symmetrical) YqeK [Paenibacillus nasutitermitis]GGD96261.1 haloacid dehalogenase [Paenibacillus nasutitermitis]
MQNVYAELSRSRLTGNLREDVYRYFVENGREVTAVHCMKVGEEARRIAGLFGADPQDAEVAGYLHDISVVFPNETRISIARQLGVEVLPEEEIFPMIIHQKLSKEMARDLFDITNPDILDAVGCHTTLRKQSTPMDKILFVADKIQWDQQGSPPYIREILQELNKSLEHASFAYIDYLWQQRDKLRVVHPWLKEARDELAPLVANEPIID